MNEKKEEMWRNKRKTWTYKYAQYTRSEVFVVISLYLQKFTRLMQQLRQYSIMKLKAQEKTKTQNNWSSPLIFA